MPAMSNPAEAPRASLNPLFHPRAIAVYGASSDPTKIGGRPLDFLKNSGFDGPLYPINPKAPQIQGLPSFASVSAVPGPVDLAIVETAKSYPTDGYRMVCCFVRRKLGVAVNRKRVLRVMREQKLIQRLKGAETLTRTAEWGVP